MAEHLIAGCRATPLASYLKALGVVRLVAEQLDPGARVWWRHERLCIASAALTDEDSLMTFFLERYRPTPIVAPWNGGSGFYEGDETSGIDAIRESTDERFHDYRAVIEQISAWHDLLPPRGQPISVMVARLREVAAAASEREAKDLLEVVAEVEQAAAGELQVLELTNAQIDEAAKSASGSLRVVAKRLKLTASKLRTKYKSTFRGDAKEALLARCRTKLPTSALPWIDAVAVLEGDGSPEYPPILATGGNEGRLDYTNAFMQRVAELLLLQGRVRERSRELLGNSLFARSAAGLCGAAAGQFDPGRAGGFNQTSGVASKDAANNFWDFVLALEGAVLWTSGVGRRAAGGMAGKLRSPFTVVPRLAGHASFASKEDAGKAARAELWAPLWERPTGHAELRQLFNEGRAQVGGAPARDGLDFARATASLGVDRGITAFVRYSLLKRRGDSYSAVPLGSFPVGYRREADLADELAPILGRLDAFLARFEDVPAAMAAARRRVDDALFELLAHGSPERARHVLRTIGCVERLLARRDPARQPALKYPLGGLSPRWLLAADDGGVELRLAAALASLHGGAGVGPLRSHLAPVDPVAPWRWALRPSRLSWTGSSLTRRMTATLSRRLMEAVRLDAAAGFLDGALCVSPADVATFLAGDCDEALIDDLVYACTWINWTRDGLSEVRSRFADARAPTESWRPLPRSYALLRSALSPSDALRTGCTGASLKLEPSIVPLLRAGRIGAACAAASHRLFVSGAVPVRVSFPDAGDGERLAASLLLPVRLGDVERRAIFHQPSTNPN